MDDIAALAKRFFDGLEQGNIGILREVYAPNVKIWHNTDGLEQTLEENETTLTGFIERIPKRQYANRRVHTFPGGFVQQHRLVGKRRDGRMVEMTACIVCAVSGGAITRLDEYFDAAQVAAWSS